MIPLEEFHPAFVHFPIVFLLCGFVLDAWLVARRRDLGAPDCLANAALALLVLGAMAAGAAAAFGDIALDRALARGFPAAPLELHEDFALATLAVFSVLAALRALARWRHLPLTGTRGWLLLLAGGCGVALLLVTAYHGGNLVYHLGVNVRAAATP